MHSGRVVGGVVGTKIPHYSVFGWGDSYRLFHSSIASQKAPRCASRKLGSSHCTTINHPASNLQKLDHPGTNLQKIDHPGTNLQKLDHSGTRWRWQAWWSRPGSRWRSRCQRRPQISWSRYASMAPWARFTCCYCCSRYWSRVDACDQDSFCGYWSNRILHYFPLSVRPSVLHLSQAWHLNFSQ